jgi:4-hydroxybenzoate polyprenyltransferase
VREYAIDLLRDATEGVGTTGERRAAARRTSGTNPLAMALLLFLVGIPMFLLFAPVGMVLIAIALVMGLWGIVATFVRGGNGARG